VPLHPVASCTQLKAAELRKITSQLLFLKGQVIDDNSTQQQSAIRNSHQKQMWRTSCSRWAAASLRSSNTAKAQPPPPAPVSFAAQP
jgi:hypothetical protein